MSQKLFCLMVGGGSLTKSATVRLYLMACNMYHARHKKHRIESFDTLITVTTNFNYGSIGMISGTEFSAVIEKASTTIQTRFLVRDFDYQSAGPFLADDVSYSELMQMPEFRASAN